MYKIWAFSEQHLIDYQTKLENATVEEIKAASSIFGKDPLPEILSISENTAQIKIYGPLSQNGPSSIARYFGYAGTGYLQIIDAINEISENDEITKVELLMNTPGGEILGVDEVFQVVKDLSEKKEVTAINQGMIASAGYWIASPAKIISNSPVNFTGSIGVIITDVDTKEMEKRYGVRVVTVVSRNAPNKNPDISKKSGVEELQKTANALEGIFIGRIAEGRGVTAEYVKKNYGRGSILVSLDPDGIDAMDVKMIDDVITEKNNNNSDIKNNKKIKTKIVNTPALLAGKNKQEVTMPTFKDFLAENPAAQGEYNAALEEKYKAGVEAGKTLVRKDIKKISPFLISSEYDDAIKAVAIKGINGEINIDTFIAMVTLEDARNAKIESTEAIKETEKIGDTPPEQALPGGNASGDITTEADFQAEIARAKAVK